MCVDRMILFEITVYWSNADAWNEHRLLGIGICVAIEMIVRGKCVISGHKKNDEMAERCG